LAPTWAPKQEEAFPATAEGFFFFVYAAGPHMCHSILLRLDGSLCDREELSRRFGFQVPGDFVRVAELIRQHSSPQALDETYYNVLRVYPRGYDARYPSTPPELFPFGSMGADGHHDGYVIHAPELSAEDYSVGSYCPMDSEGVVFKGSGTLDAFEAMMSFSLASAADELDDLAADEDSLDDDEEGEWIEQERKKLSQRVELIAAVARTFGLAPATEKSGREYGPDRNGLPVPPFIPVGWRHVLSSDWIGVLAPASAFQTHAGPSVTVNTPPENVVAAARAALDAGFPATALLDLREAYWLHRHDQRRLYVDVLAEAYEALGRPVLAEIVRRRGEHSRTPS
jgi:hypothetical protein